jgi:hypothetical protein
MTVKDQIFVMKAVAMASAFIYFILFCYFAALPEVWWDEALLQAADKTFWFTVVACLLMRALLELVQRHHNKKG